MSNWDNGNLIDLYDLVSISQGYDKQYGDSGYRVELDLDWDNRVGLPDLVYCARNYGRVGAK
jgi:hypothetical protein